jgi:probable non-F420 flavinoid oxidoreductase
MATIGYHCSHEQYAPGELLQYAKAAAEAGFAAGMCSDHFHPWSEQGESGFAWSWLGAALEATALSFGMVCAPGQRYHPAIIAQASATLAQMYPGRLWCAFGSGQNLNEHITGTGWPNKATRQARLEECVEIIRALWAGERVSHKGLVVVNEAKLYTRPAQPPLLLGAALSNESAEWVAGWADGVITSAKPYDDQCRFIEHFQRGGGAGKPMYMQSLVAYAQDDDQARQGAWERWRTNVFGNHIQAELPLPAHYDEAAQVVRPEEMQKSVRISADLDQHIAWLQQDIALGFERIFVFNATSDQRALIRAYGEHVLPALA